MNQVPDTNKSSMQSRCLVIHAPQDLRIQTLEPEALQGGQVCVQVAFGGICGSDLHYFQHGGFGTVRIKRPMILGHEVAGIVIQVAADVSHVQVGDRVAVNPSRPCLQCQYCLVGQPNQCLDMRFYGSAMRDPHVEGAFRNVLVCDANQCARLSATVPLEHAALAEPFSVALHGVSRAGSLLGKRVLVSGCGPIGTLAVAAAVVHGAAEVIAVDMTDEPLQIARSMGAHVLVNGSTDEHWCSRYNVNKGTVDVVMECSGSASALRAALDVIRPRGVIVQLGLGGDVSVPQNTIVAKEICICGSFRFHAEFPLAVRLINEGRVDLSPMITRAFPLERARDAFELAGNRRRAMKVLLDFNSAGN